ncbi:DUF4913 domain-containing protein [Arthrobacter sp. 162MFSha1.1]|uniref:DUF4913 domain-containing protein n=1 Tax=Arthrobacter sp. 162MFSha1.1 TaxID=1151119 RepID=UPI002F2B3FF3
MEGPCRAWEHLRPDGATGMSAWSDHAAHHMSVLLDPGGPFYNATCTNIAIPNI